MFAISVSNAVAGAVPTSASVERLLLLTEAPRIVEKIPAQVNSAIEAVFTQELKGKQLNQEAQAKLNREKQDAFAYASKEISWEAFSPAFIQLYQELFTQEEIDGMIAFYQTPAGKASLAKLPVANQRSSDILRERLIPVMRRVKEAAAQIMSKP